MNQLNLLTILLAHRLRKSAKELCKRKCRKAQKEEKMILSVILGVAVDTPVWIAELQRNKANHIVVIDYDYLGEPQQRENILYLSPIDAKNYMKQFDSVEFFTSFYSFPSIGNRAPVLKKIQFIHGICRPESPKPDAAGS